MNLKISNIYAVGGFNRAKTIVKRVVPLPTAHTACNAVDTGGFLNLCSTYLYIHYTQYYYVIDYNRIQNMKISFY